MGGPRTYAVETGRHAAGGTRMGPRHAENEDSLRIAEAVTPEQTATHGHLYLVADGVGGHNRGEVASALAVDAIARAYFAAGDGAPTQRLEAAIAQANLEVHRSAETVDENSGMATTIVAATVRDGQIAVANVGDSRAYLVTGGEIRQISRDHSLVQDQVDHGWLTPEEARVSPQRNIITRALGLAEIVEIDLRTEQEAAARTRLVLCTDGVHGVVEDGELAGVAGTLDPATAVQRILALVDERRGRDDATLIIVEIDAELPPPAASAGTGERRGVFTRMIHRLRKR